MNRGRTVFAQLLDFVPYSHFEHLVDQFSSNHGIRHFSAWSQFLCMMYSQLTRREGLRDLVACLNSQRAKLYHIGIRSKISRSTLADANERRDWRLFEALGHRLIATAVELYHGEDIGIGLKEPLYAMDSTTIDLCLSLFPWADFRSTKAAIKAHTIVDLRGAIPVFVHITNGKVHECQHSRSDSLACRFNCCHRSRLSRFRETTSTASRTSVLRYPCQGQHALHSVRFARGRQIHRTAQRSNHPVSDTEIKTRLPRSIAPYFLSRPRDKQVSCLPYQSFRSAGTYHHRDLSEAMVCRNLFQVDQAKLVGQALLRQLNQRRQVANLDRCVRLSRRHHCPETSEPPGIAPAFA